MLPYQRLIAVKERVKEEKERLMKSLLSDLEKIEAESLETERKILESRDLMLGGLDGSDFSVLSEYLFSLERRRQELAREKRERQAQIDALRAELVEILKGIKMLQQLKSKELKAQRKAREKKVQKRIDEISARKKKDI